MSGHRQAEILKGASMKTFLFLAVLAAAATGYLLGPDTVPQRPLLVAGSCVSPKAPWCQNPTAKGLDSWAQIQAGNPRLAAR